MRAELLTALEAISEGMTLLRARGGNPNHKGSGPGGGQFTSSGTGGGATHGRGNSTRARRKKRKLEKLKKKGHARIAELKTKHAKERKALRSKHREKGASYSDRSRETKALRTSHKAESRATIDSIKKEVREAFPKSQGKSDKAKEYRERLEKGTQKLGEIHSQERSKMHERHEGERKTQLEGHRAERREIRSAHAKERAELVADNNKYHREDAQFAIQHTKGQPPEARREALQHNRETHAGRLRDALKSQREDHAEEHASHQDAVAEDRRSLAKTHKEIRQHVDKAHKMERREAITRLSQEIKSRAYSSGVAKRDGGQSDHYTSIFNPSVGADLRWNDQERYRRLDVASPIRKRFGRSKTHKASSAEAILKHMLRQRGFTSAWKRSELSGKQHLNLLEDVREYSRQYLRHEAESFFDQYGVVVDVDSITAGRSFDSGLAEHDASPAGSIPQDARGPLCSDDRIHEVARSLASRAAGALSRLFDRTRQFIREIITAGAIALKGDDPLTNAEIYALERLTRKQYEYLQKFEQEVQQNPPKEIADLSSQIIVASPPPMTPGQFTARLESYGNAPWGVQNVGREIVKKQQVFKAERRVHFLSMEQHRPCKGPMGCIDQSQLGWQPMGSLLEIGDCYCMYNCDCYFEWQDKDNKIHVSPWGRHNPRGYNQPGENGTQLPGIAFPPDQPAIKELPSGPGPEEKKRKKIVIEPAPKVGGKYPKGGTYPPARPLKSVKELLEEAGSPYGADEYEEA